MFKGQQAFLALLALAGCSFSAAAQNTKDEFWPEADLFVNVGSTTRLVFVDSFNQDQNTRNTQGSFTYFFDLALKPVFRRELRQQEDVFLSRLLTFRAGYRYSTSFVNGDPSSERRGIIETTARVPLPGKVLLSDRNRGEFRFINSQPFSMRYRNRLQVERDFRIGRLVFTPYVYDELYYDTRYNVWTPNRYAFGVQVPAGPHLVLEPYVLRQNDKRSTPTHVNAFGLTFNLYF